MAKYANVDEYMAALPDDRRVVMEQIRGTIRSAARPRQSCDVGSRSVGRRGARPPLPGHAGHLARTPYRRGSATTPPW